MKLAVVLSLTFLAVSDCRRLGRCEVARIFREQGLDGFEGFKLGNYVCMAFWESKWKTHKVRESGETGKDYGIFQINSFKWCDDGTQGGKNQCNVPCAAMSESIVENIQCFHQSLTLEDLLKDDLIASVTCAKMIVKTEGLKAWDTWDSFCKGRKMERWVKGCEVK